MNLPTDGSEDIGGTCITLFDHIEKLYVHEEDKALKVLFALKKTLLNRIT